MSRHFYCKSCHRCTIHASWACYCRFRDSICAVLWNWVQNGCSLADFLVHLAVCNTVVPTTGEDGEPVYQVSCRGAASEKNSQKGTNKPQLKLGYGSLDHRRLHRRLFYVLTHIVITHFSHSLLFLSQALNPPRVSCCMKRNL